MISESVKIYCICNQCSKKASCVYYIDVVRAVKHFADTPLNIHFPMCKDYDSILNKLSQKVKIR